MFPIRDNVPTRQFPVVTVALIVVNALVYFLYQLPDLQASVDQLAYHPCEVERSCPVVGENWPVTVLTSMFMHADLLHLGGNMLFLWIFGNNVEDAMGKLRYLVFYLLAGAVATAAQTVVTLETADAAGAAVANLGASGAVSGVLGAYFLLFPRARILTAFLIVVLFFLREVPAFLFLGIYFLFQAWEANFQLRNPPQGGGVAVFAHVGGIAFGLLAVFFFRRRRRPRPAS